MLLNQKHVFSWRGSPEAGQGLWMEVMDRQVQASPGFWQELESSLSWKWGADCGQFSSLACAACFSSCLWMAVPAAKRRSKLKACAENFDILGQKVIKEGINASEWC